MRRVQVGLMSLAILAGCSAGESEIAGSSNGGGDDANAGKVMAAGPPATAGLPDGYQARGQEPGWALVIEGGQLAYAREDGKQRIGLTLPAATAQPGGLTYASPQLTLRVHYQRCNDVMSGEGFEHEVEVTVGGEKHSGCGGERRPAWDL